MLTGVRATTAPVVLVFAVADFVHTRLQQTVPIVGQQGIPVSAPDYLDHVPASATENTFQFLDDFAVTAYRTVQTLQVAVDDKNQVVQAFTAGLADCTQ